MPSILHTFSKQILCLVLAGHKLTINAVISIVFSEIESMANSLNMLSLTFRIFIYRATFGLK